MKVYVIVYFCWFALVNLCITCARQPAPIPRNEPVITHQGRDNSACRKTQSYSSFFYWQ